MAQFFYNLAICDPLTSSYPSAAKGYKPPTTELSEFGQGFVDKTERAWIYSTDDDATEHTCYGLGLDLGDFELLYKTRVMSVPSSIFLNTGPAVAFRVSTLDSTGRPDDCYYVVVGDGTSTNRGNISLYSIVSGSQTLISSVDGDELTGVSDIEVLDVDLFIRVLVSGNNIKAKAWRSDGSEPVDWDIDVNDTTFTDSGDVAIMCHRYEMTQAQYFLSIGTGADSAPSSITNTVSGTLLEPDDSPADGYTVRCFDRATGYLLGADVTNGSGGFSIDVETIDPVTLVAYDDNGDVWNAVIRDLVDV